MTRSEILALARLAKRTAKRNWVRTALIVALIAIPVAAAQVGAGMMAVSRITPEEQADRWFGTAEARIEAFGADSAVRDWVAEEIERQGLTDSVLRHQSIYASAPGVSNFVEVSDLDLTSPTTDGMAALVEGNLPTSSAEIAVSPALVTLGDLVIGDTIAVAGPGNTRSDGLLGEFVITGVVRDALDVRRTFAITTPDGMADILNAPRTAPLYAETQWLVTGSQNNGVRQLQIEWDRVRDDFLPPPAVSPRPEELARFPDELYRSLTAAQIEELVATASTVDLAEMQEIAYGMTGEVYAPTIQVSDRSIMECCAGDGALNDVLQAPSVLATIGAALLLAEVALVAGAAYATGTRRRLRELGLMSVNGATDSHLRWAVVGEGLVAGVLGAAIGTALGVGTLQFAQPVIQGFVSRLVDGIPIGPLELVGPALVGIAAATVAAWVPARSVARVPATTALQGRMPLKAPQRWVAPLGLGLAGFGSFLLIVAKSVVDSSGVYQAGLGVVLMIGGFALLAGPMVAWVGNRADRLPATLRLVARDSARQRTKAATAMAATMVVLLAPVMMGVAARTDESMESIWGLPDDGRQVLVGTYDWSAPFQEGPVTAEQIAEVKAVIPDSVHVPLVGYAGRGVLAGIEEASGSDPDSTDLNGAMGIAMATPELLAALELDDALGGDVEAVVLGLRSRNVDVNVEGTTVQARELPVRMMRHNAPRLLVTDELAKRLGLAQDKKALMFVSEQPLTEKQRLELTQIRFPVAFSYPQSPSVAKLQLMGMAGSLVVVLAIIGLVTALATTESDRDLTTMVAVGAPPSIRRRFLGLQTTYYTLFAAALAVPLGLLLYKVSLQDLGYAVGPFGRHRLDSVVIPWAEIGLVVGVIPLVVGLVTATVARSAAVTPPRRNG